MEFEIIHSSPYIQLIEKDDGFYIESFDKGYGLDEFNELLKALPQVKITNFLALRKVILEAPQYLTKFAEKREAIEVEISKDRLKAYITLFISNSLLNGVKRKEIEAQILEVLKKEGIVYGIRQNALLTELKSKAKILIAEGKPPIDGKPSKIKMYEITEPKPKITEDGSVNHYELNLINKVEKGAWLGERIDGTPGEPGKSVLGEVIPAKRGKQFPLLYDKHSVEEVYDKETGITTLIAKKTGAVFYRDDMIYVNDCLEINGDVSFETGNIDFDGFVNIKGSIEDNFSVEAKNDIEVMSVMGVGGVEKIQSRNGSIYIRGGIAGKNKAHLYCCQDLYTKFASDCTIECDGTVHIGFYSINCNIKAKQVIFESIHSRIIGGNIDAEIKVVANEVGNRTEIPTSIIVKGFNRKELNTHLDDVNASIKDISERLVIFKQKLATYAGNSSEEHLEDYKKITNEFEEIKEALKLLQLERKKCLSYLHTKGEGEISIGGTIHGKTTLMIKNHVKRFFDQITGPTTYYVMNNQLMSE